MWECVSLCVTVAVSEGVQANSVLNVNVNFWFVLFTLGVPAEVLFG